MTNDYDNYSEKHDRKGRLSECSGADHLFGSKCILQRLLILLGVEGSSSHGCFPARCFHGGALTLYLVQPKRLWIAYAGGVGDGDGSLRHSDPAPAPRGTASWRRYGG